MGNCHSWMCVCAESLTGRSLHQCTGNQRTLTFDSHHPVAHKASVVRTLTSYNILWVIFGISYSTISLYLCVSVHTLRALKSTFINLKRVEFLFDCPKAQMRGAILAMTRHGGHFPNSAILSSTFFILYSVFCVLLTPFTCTVCICVLMHVRVVCV